MCSDPNTSKEIAGIKAEIHALNERVKKLELAIDGDGSKESGMMPRLAAMESKLNLLLWLWGGTGLTIFLAVGKYLFKG